jgi:cysteinyl-tRNA synthetase
MSKSLGNFVLASDALATRDPLVIRYALGAAHYRSSLDISDRAFDEAEAALDRIRTFLERSARQGGADPSASEVPAEFAAAMDDDLGVPQALAAVHETVRAGNAALDAGETDAAAAAYGQVRPMTAILGIDPFAPEWQRRSGAEASALDTLVQTMIAQRADARAAKDWAAADRVRDAIAAAGITLEDTPDGTHWSIDGK